VTVISFPKLTCAFNTDFEKVSNHFSGLFRVALQSVTQCCSKNNADYWTVRKTPERR